MDDNYFLLDSGNRTLLLVIARVMIAVMTFLLLLPTLLVSVLLTVLIILVPARAHRTILAPADGIWHVLLWALLKSSRTWEQMPLLRLPLLIVGVPLALISYVFVGCLPPRPHAQAKNSKLALCDQWPLTWSLWCQLDDRPSAKARVSSFLPDSFPPRW